HVLAAPRRLQNSREVCDWGFDFRGIGVLAQLLAVSATIGWLIASTMSTSPVPSAVTLYGLPTNAQL
ncbi:MAG: hypothetical protein WAM08_08285, partial [Candidatus Acidiferrales bacterium]